MQYSFHIQPENLSSIIYLKIEYCKINITKSFIPPIFSLLVAWIYPPPDLVISTYAEALWTQQLGLWCSHSGENQLLPFLTEHHWFGKYYELKQTQIMFEFWSAHYSKWHMAVGASRGYQCFSQWDLWVLSRVCSKTVYMKFANFCNSFYQLGVDKISMCYHLKSSGSFACIPGCLRRFQIILVAQDSGQTLLHQRNLSWTSYH